MDAQAEEGDADASDVKRKEKQEEEVKGLWLGCRGCGHISPPSHLRDHAVIQRHFCLSLEPVRDLAARPLD